MLAAGQSDRLDIAAGELAETQATDPTVQAYARQLVDNATSDLSQISAVINDMGTTATLPPLLSNGQVPLLTDDGNALVSELGTLTGDAFDQTFVNAMVLSQESTIAQFQAEAAHGQDTTAQAYATNTLPALQQNLQLGLQLQQNLQANKGA